MKGDVQKVNEQISVFQSVLQREIDESYFTVGEWSRFPQICIVIAISFVTEKQDEYMMMYIYDKQNKYYFKNEMAFC